MKTLLDAFQALKPWQLGTLFIVLIGAIGGSYGVYTLVSDSGDGGLAEGQQLIPVQSGDLVNQVSTNGSLVFPNRETLAFGTQGTVGEVLVEDGERVQEGQTLVALDGVTVASLEEAVALAGLTLRNAEDALAEAQNPHTPLDLALAESNVAKAQLSLSDARIALGEVESGPVVENVAGPEARVNSASTTLANALGDLALARTEWDEKVQGAENAFEAALSGYMGVFKRWLGIELKEVEIAMDPDALLSSWSADLDALFDPGQQFQAMADFWLGSFVSLDDPSTLWDEETIFTWLNMFPGTVAPTCDDGVVPSRGTCVKKEMDDAWDAYQIAKDDLDTVLTQAAKAIANAELAVAKAEESFNTLEVEARRKQLAVAAATLVNAEEELAELTGSVDTLEVAVREAELASAQAALDTAIQRLEGATLLAPMAGIVSRVNVEPGQTVNVNTTVVEVVDPTVVEVDGIVDEIDVLFVQEGQRATVTLDALPDQVLEGAVSEIAAAASNQQGVVTYPIRILVDVPQGVQVREGLSATANIVLREERNVLLVPVQALYGTFQQPTVQIMNDGRIEERAVVLGNSDDFWVAVREGLAVGDLVVIETREAATTNQFNFGPGRGGFVGGSGFPGGGGGGQQRR